MSDIQQIIAAKNTYMLTTPLFYGHYTGQPEAFSALMLLIGWQEGHLA